jgi:hypothetical protein
MFLQNSEKLIFKRKEAKKRKKPKEPIKRGNVSEKNLFFYQLRVQY